MRLVVVRPQWRRGKRGKRSRIVGIFAVGHPWPAPFQRRNRGQKQPIPRSDSGLAAKGVFRLFHCAWVKIPNTFAYSPFFLSQLYWGPRSSFAGFSRSFFMAYTALPNRRIKHIT
ncbi:hypothetical protein EDM58_17105 [Brevibacillus panacihumi]|uniref:Uncharacterized protein n=1 Tax=Brevibacillus panacihumi TaxID=497735 RepID=A0A3M8CMA6_9BACL|nr:hypothetical protein EDM58_17105 [Brevibacillus panacihumi]